MKIRFMVDFKQLLFALFKRPAVYDAILLKAATKGLGTNEKVSKKGGSRPPEYSSPLCLRRERSKNYREYRKPLTAANYLYNVCGTCIL